MQLLPVSLVRVAPLARRESCGSIIARDDADAKRWTRGHGFPWPLVSSVTGASTVMLQFRSIQPTRGRV